LSSAATKSISTAKNSEGITNYLVVMPEWRGKPQANKLKQFPALQAFLMSLTNQDRLLI
jgi:hypothetical protein